MRTMMSFHPADSKQSALCDTKRALSLYLSRMRSCYQRGFVAAVVLTVSF